MICSFVFSNKVSAYELTDFCDYTDPCVSTEYFDILIENKGLDPELYKNYFASFARKDTGGFYFYAFVYKDNATFTIITNEDGSYKFNYKGYYYTNYVFSGNSDFFKLNPPTSLYTKITISDTFSFSPDIQETFVYYSNKDILDSDGNVVLYRNDIEVPKEDPNVVNNRAFLVKLTNFYKSLFLIISDIASTIIITPILVIPFGFCILAIIVGVFYKLFLRR